jgi:hypothetical protein
MVSWFIIHRRWINLKSYMDTKEVMHFEVPFVLGGLCACIIETEYNLNISFERYHLAKLICFGS